MGQTPSTEQPAAAPVISMEDQIYDIQEASRDLAKHATTCKGKHVKELKNVKKAMEEDDMQGARIYAQNAIRHKTEQLNYMLVASQLDSTAGKLSSQRIMQDVGKTIEQIVLGLNHTLANNHMEKITHTMNQFEKQTNTLDIISMVMGDVMGRQAALSTPEDQVQNVLQQVADAHGLQSKMSMPEVGGGGLRNQQEVMFPDVTRMNQRN